MDVGDQMREHLIDTNIDRGYIDFKKVSLYKHG